MWARRTHERASCIWKNLRILLRFSKTLLFFSRYLRVCDFFSLLLCGFLLLFALANLHLISSSSSSPHLPTLALNLFSYSSPSERDLSNQFLFCHTRKLKKKRGKTKLKIKVCIYIVCFKFFPPIKDKHYSRTKKREKIIAQNRDLNGDVMHHMFLYDFIFFIAQLGSKEISKKSTFFHP